MHPAKGSALGRGLTYGSSPITEGQKQDDSKFASTDSTVDSGFHSGQNFSSDNFTSSSSLSDKVPSADVPPASGIVGALFSHPHHNAYQQQQQQQLYLSGSANSAGQKQQQEEDIQTLDSGVQDLDSSQQYNSTTDTSEPMRIENDLCASLQQLQMSPKDLSFHQRKWAKYFHQNDDGDTFLHLAIIHEAEEAVIHKLIREAHRSWLDIQNDIGQTPLHLAVLTGQQKTVRRLIVGGAQPGIRDVEGNTPLHLACLHSQSDCARELLMPLNAIELAQCSPAAREALKTPQDLEQWNYNGKRCVHIAAEMGNIEILRFLISAGADVNSREGKSGLTALHIAIETGNEQLANFLLDECPKLRLEQVTYGGLTAYQLAARQHNQTLLKGLRLHGAEPLTPPESDYDEEDEEDDDETIDDEKIRSFYGANAFGSNFATLSTINVA